MCNSPKASQVTPLADQRVAVTQLGWIVEVGHIRQLVSLSQRPQNLFVDLVANVGRTLQSHHVCKAGSSRDGDWGVRLTSVLVADVLHEQQNQHVILVLAGIHAASQFVTGLPEGGVKGRFFDCHLLMFPVDLSRLILVLITRSLLTGTLDSLQNFIPPGGQRSKRVRGVVAFGPKGNRTSQIQCKERRESQLRKWGVGVRWVYLKTNIEGVPLSEVPYLVGFWSIG